MVLISQYDGLANRCLRPLGQRSIVLLYKTVITWSNNKWCPVTESNCQSMITSQVLCHLTNGALDRLHLDLASLAYELQATSNTKSKEYNK